jgi:hypothetical protein
MGNLFSGYLWISHRTRMIFFILSDFYDLFSFLGHAVTFHIWVQFIKGLFHKMSMIVNAIIIILANYKVIFTLSFNIFCDKILFKSSAVIC